MKYLTASLILTVCVSPTLAVGPLDRLGPAIERGLDRLQQGSHNYTTKRQCFSCHHQAMTIAAFTTARQQGYNVPEKALDAQVEFTLASFRSKKDTIAKGQAVGGGNTTAAYALFALAASGHKADATTTALIDFLLVRQRGDGCWPAVANRPPTEGSSFTSAGMALTALRAYGGTEKARKSKVDDAVQRGRQWLLKNRPATHEDRVFHLRGLVASSADKDVIADACKTLLAEQRRDGGWAQLAELDSDAYATGTALVVLRLAGVSSKEPAYLRGIGYLLRTQSRDGAWLVQTRSRPIQTFFDNGDPGGKSQFISFAATGWATLALLEATR